MSSHKNKAAEVPTANDYLMQQYYPPPTYQEAVSHPTFPPQQINQWYSQQPNIPVSYYPSHQIHSFDPNFNGGYPAGTAQPIVTTNVSPMHYMPIGYMNSYMTAGSSMPSSYIQQAHGSSPTSMQQPVVMGKFDAGARFNAFAKPAIPPPPPNCPPNAAQIAAMQNQSVAMGKDKSSFWTGGKGAGVSFW